MPGLKNLVARTTQDCSAHVIDDIVSEMGSPAFLAWEHRHTPRRGGVAGWFGLVADDLCAALSWRSTRLSSARTRTIPPGTRRS